MKKDKVKKWLMTCLSMVCACFLLIGCSDGTSAEDDSKQNNNSKESANISKAEYIGLLGTEFGYDEYISENAIFSDVDESSENYAQIQACSEWGILKETTEFKPDESITLEYALKAAVRALNLEGIVDGMSLDEDDELISFYNDYISKVDTSELDKELDEETAVKVIEQTSDYRDSIEIPQIYEYELVENVKEANGDIFLDYSGTTGIIVGNADYKVGDIVYWEGSDTGAPMAAKITSVDNGIFTYETPELEEVYSSLDISGTYDGTVITATSASDGTNVEFGQELYDEVNNYGMSYYNSDNACIQTLGSSVKTEKGNDFVRFTANADASAKGNGSSGKVTGTLVAEIKNIKVTIEYDNNILNPKYVTAKLTFDTNVSSTITGEFSKSIPLGEVWISVAGPIQLRLVMTANVGANGEVSLSYTTDNVLTVGYKKNAGLQKSFKCVPELNFEAEATVTAEVTALADLIIGFNVCFTEYSKSILNAEVTTGLVAIAKTDGDLLSEEPMCTDIVLYVPLRWGINQESCILTSINSKFKYKQTVWDSESSELKTHLHFEDGVRTADDLCTRGEGEEIVQEDVDENGDPFEGLELFEFEMIDFDFIKLDSNLIMLNEGESASIQFTSIPEGYSKSDLIYEVTDTNVCSVISGNIIAQGAGTTVVKVKTSDGMYATSFGVTVFEDFSVDDFEPL